jgi:hypothetical protein
MMIDAVMALNNLRELVKKANFARQLPKLPAGMLAALRRAGSKASLGANNVNSVFGKHNLGAIDDAASVAEKQLRARAALFGSTAPNLELVPGIAEKMDLIRKAAM